MNKGSSGIGLILPSGSTSYSLAWQPSIVCTPAEIYLLLFLKWQLYKHKNPFLLQGTLVILPNFG